jgi:erythronate-4-phosphate dehydrogenase
MPTIIADEHIPFLKGVLEPYARLIYKPGDQITKDDIANADGLIIRTRTHCNAEFLEGSRVKFIASATIGFDHIDTAYCESNGIKWFHAPGCNSSAVYQYMAAALTFLRPKYNLHYEDITIGIVGVGNVGTKVARLAHILGMKALLNDPPRARIEGRDGFVDLETILEEADIISFHVPLNRDGKDSTFHMATEDTFIKMKKQPIVINTSRGEVIDTNAIKAALKDSRIKAAVLDVWEDEPLLDPELLDQSCLATPHIAGYSFEGKANGTAACVRNASEYFGFPMANWHPENLPEPQNPFLHPEVKNIEDTVILSTLISSCYNIRKDDHLLRSHPEKFEDLRSNYHYRREFPAFSVDPGIFNPELASRIRELGFSFIKKEILTE